MIIIIQLRKKFHNSILWNVQAMLVAQCVERL